MSWRVRIKQTYISLTDSRIQIKIKEVFPFFKSNCGQHFLYRHFLDPYDFYQLQYIRITCMQLVFYLWGTYGMFGLNLWGSCGYVQFGLHIPFVRCMDM